MNLWFGTKINKNYAWELTLFYKFRPFEDGISFIEFDINLDTYEDDHKPAFNARLTILNITIFEFEIYYLWHRGGNNEMDN